MEITYGSICSGIEAATLAWKPLGMRATWFAEIEAFPSEVLAHHYPNTPNLGDMTKLGALVLAGKIAAPDVLVGGTPCQAFSVAGMRQGLLDPRGALTIKYVELADATDYVRASRRKPPCVLVWENVPGVLSDKRNAFGCFLGALAGEDCELQPSGKKWPDAGCVYGPKRTIAWRVLDAQYFGLAQRRRRVFVVASARDGFDPTEVLFEREGVRRDTAPRRGEGQDVTGTLAGGARQNGGYSTDDLPLIAPALRAQAQSSHRADAKAFIPVSAYGGGRTSGPIDVAACLVAKGQKLDFEVESFVVHGSQDPCVSDVAFALGRNQGQENAILALSGKDHGADAGEVAPNQSGVRRLTPRECERLQGMPDDYTLIPWRGKPASECPDGPRYKAIGNSKAVPVVRWVGMGIQKALMK
jgi:DNA (cytosine-5)-methyltransferase 1